MSQQAEFWNHMAAKYFKTPVKNQNVYKSKLDQIRQLLHSNADVLELGCGTGSTALLLSSKVRQYDACDFSESMINIAKTRATEDDIHNISFTVEDIETYSIPSEKYDLVMAHSVLHLINNADSVVEAMMNALKPNGYIVFSLVLLNNIPLPLRWLLMLGQKTGFVPHLVYQRKSELLSPLIRGHFQVQTSWKIDTNNVFVIARKPNEHHV
ncbi:class I SAM-dependent methyltransferase [Vibrio sp. DW001]|uniref:class I SAM-dependent methyltransferase n=1 Tax=Vibrio sp. DW001 TaxID=2912315 RepID=UPI0023AF36B3|nr:class I SAM-dependent methyltransferase [Vibrio sp. DW001]WED25663.1 class I SAM-dependent methyltransferase [Vibrio sp. DW001]